ncbi:DM13 domain-containing protein [Bauldia sp.]|uniref:DM13 domain-containing protein n=1 Tax=Bauldia sp. TaxID=2575872 RepID=UPI003BA96B2D
MWKTVAVFLFGGVVGSAFGVAVGLFAYPFLFPPPAANEMLTAADRSNLVATGTFIHADPSDPIHYGSGGVSVYERTVFLEPDFEVGPGPKYHVYLVPKANIRDSRDVVDTMYVDLGQLRAFEGSQRYEIPAGVDLADFPSVVIWCEAFSVLISPADLDPAGTASETDEPATAAAEQG